MNTVISFKAPWQQPGSFRNREWLITNGLGGYASGTLAGIATRRYHGLFIPNLAAPKGRHLLISRLDEYIDIAGQCIALSGAAIEHGPTTVITEEVSTPISPQAHHMNYVSAIDVGSNSVKWIYQLPELLLEKTIVMPHLRNTVCVRYRLLVGNAISMRIRPFLPLRRQDAALGKTHATQLEVNTDSGQVCVCRKDTSLKVHMALRPAATVATAFVSAPQEAVDQLLRREQVRGYPCYESTISPGYFDVQLAVGQDVEFIATVHPNDLVDASVDKTLNDEAQRVATMLRNTPMSTDEFIAKLTVAADQFLVRPESRPEDAVQARNEGHLLRSVIAGYHWFGDWGRDTMISLEGLMLCTGRHGEARATLLTFAQYIQDGLLPNLFPEGENAGLYHTVDASLWYFHAVHRYISHSHDMSILNDLMPALRDIIAHHLKGTRFGIQMDPADGLIVANSPAHPLTWMDAHMGQWIVTPRRGKPVEIQALWYNALRLMASWEVNAGKQANRYDEYAEHARISFNKRFWNSSEKCLYDVIDGEANEDVRGDASVRPNQVFAISLDYPVLATERWREVVAVVEEQLLTPYGLRTLTRNDPAYRPTYFGNLSARDAAYHQGTVWPWLIGHFIDAWLRVYPEPARARSMLAAFPDHLAEAGIGTISEVFDAQLPHVPHGCIAQAWSVAEVLRAWQRTAHQ